MVWATFEVDCARNHTFYNDFVEKKRNKIPDQALKWTPPVAGKVTLAALEAQEQGKRRASEKWTVLG